MQAQKALALFLSKLKDAPTRKVTKHHRLTRPPFAIEKTIY